MKRILLLLLLLLPIVALAQYPTFSNKQKLGVQTTGDGLIYRGGIHPNYYTPSNINNAYFYLDTTVSKLYLYSVGTWQQVYPTASDTLSLGDYLLKSDTLAMLLPYLRKSDTISLSNRINNKLSLADTASMLLPYLKLADTTSMLTPYFRDSDTTMLNLITRFNSKLNTTDTVSLSDRINLKLNPIDTISLSNRINIKLNPSDTVSLSNRINTKLDTLYVNYQTSIDTIVNKDTINITTLEAGTGINITNNVISLDTTLLDSVVRVQNVYVKNGTGTVLNKGEAVYVTGANGTNIIVGRASNIAESSSSKTLGLTMTSIAINGFGYVVKEGLLAGLNTNSANAGDPIWLGVNGAVIYGLANKPYAPNHLVYLGVVTRKQQNNGEVYVTVQNGFEIKELHDVQIIEPVNKASLYYNLSESLWRDTTAALLVSDTVSMLSKYVNTYSNQTGINGNKTFNNVITIDSATVTGKLLVNTNISDAVKISSNTNSTNLELMNSSGTVSIKSSNKNMILQTDTTALVYLNGDNKKVGILTMNPQQELEVNGNARITGLNNNLVPTRMIGSDNNGDLTNVNLGQGLSFANDTLKVDLTIIDTAIAASSITLAGHVTGTGSTNSTVNTTISNNVVTNDMLAGSISDTKLNTITTAGKVSNSATTATSSNTNSAIVSRDGSGDFSARNITATNFYGNATTATIANGVQSFLTTGIIKLATPSNSVQPTITVPDVNATMATTNLSQTFTGTQTFSNTISGSISGNASTATNVAYSGLTGVVPIWNQNTTGNAATVTSVLPSNFASQTANTVLAAPNGSNGTPTFRSLVSTDIPNLNYLPLTGGTLTGGLSGTTSTFSGQLNLNYSSGFTGGGIITDPGNISGIKLYDSGAGNMTIFNKSVSTSFGSIIFSTGNSSGLPIERMRITHEGNVNINNNHNVGGTLGVTGATTLSSTLGVTGAATFSNTSRFIGNVAINTTTAYKPVEAWANANDFISLGVRQMQIGEYTGIHFGYVEPNTDYRKSAIVFQRRDYGSPFDASGSIHILNVNQGQGGRSANLSDAKLTISNNGNVGVNDTTPSFNLDVNGTLGVTGATTLSSTLGVTGATTLNNILTINSGANTNSLSINNTGTSNILSMYSTNNNSFTRSEYKNGLTGNTTSDGLNVGYFDGGYFVNYENTKSYLYTNNNTNQLVLDTDGNVGVGIADATAKLDVSGTLKVSGTTTLSNLGTNGTRMVVTDNNGLLSTQAIPSSGSGTVTNVSAGSPANGLSVATPTTTPVISIALANGTSSSGVVSTGTQIFGGSKTFSSNLIVNTISVGKGNNSLAGNTVVGLNALSSTTVGTYNTAVGEVSLRDNLIGDYNTALGSNSLSLNTTGSYNTAIGQASLYNNNANHNTAVGESAAEFTTGSSNTAVGSQAMYNLTTGTDNTIIGYNSNASIVGATNQIVIGSGVVGQANNTVTIGSISGKIYNNYTTNATWTQTSDGRLKNIIAKDSLGLSFINRLNPITYTWKPSNDLPINNPYYNAINNKDTTTVIHGFVAQEIKAALDAENCSTFNGWIKGDDGIEGISREMFINPLVKAIQELSAQIEILKAEIKELKKQ